MKTFTFPLFRILLLVFAIYLVSNCTKKENNNPFDADCPKELFTPSNFSAQMQSQNVKLSWQQENLNISGYVVNRSENDGSLAEVARIDKATTTWTDTKIAGGAKYNYQLYAYAGANMSNPLQTNITIPALSPTVTTVADATSVTPNSAVLGGNVTGDGGAAVTERGICYGTSANPTIANGKTVMGNGTGIFSGTVNGLAGNTTYYVKAFATNSYGTAYGSEISFKTTQLLLATVSTTAAASVTLNSAVLGGNVTSDGGATVTERGVCYGTAQNPTIANSKLAIGNGIGTFSNTVTALTEGTTYYAKAYATNSQGTAYGTQITFITIAPALATVTTSNATNVTGTTVVLGGNVTNDGNSTVTERGVCYGITQNPTTANTKLAIGTGTGIFSNTVSGLTGNTTYYTRAYAINGKGTAYGNEVSFKTTILLSLATVTTDAATNLKINGATLGGSVTNDGGAAVSERGICYNTGGNPTTSSPKVAVGSGIGNFNSDVIGLQPNTTYQVKAYAINSVGTAYGNQVAFITMGNAPTASTKDVTNILETSAVAGGIVLTDEGSAVTERGICYGTSTNPTIYDSKIASGSGLGNFNIPLSTLIPNTTYYVRAYATNKNGTAYGENKSFKSVDGYYAGFENGLPAGWSGGWAVSSDSPFEGFYCLKSASPNESIEFTLTIVNPLGGQISFYHKADGGFFGDILTPFFIDDVLQTTFTDEGAWTLKTFTLSQGKHKFKWINNGSTNTFGGGNHFNYIDYVICTK